MIEDKSWWKVADAYDFFLKAIATITGRSNQATVFVIETGQSLVEGVNILISQVVQSSYFGMVSQIC